MAERRMFAKTIIDSDAFLEMPLSTQALYFHLSMRADDEGFINNPKKIQRMIGAADDDLKVLIAKNFVIPFESGIVVIKHWKIHNYIRGDRLHATKYQDEKTMLETKENGAYTLNLNEVDISKVTDICQTSDSQMSDTLDTEVRLGKVRLGKDSIELGKVSISSAQSPKTDSEPEADVESITLNDGTEWKPSESLFKEYVRLYPNVDVKQQFNVMRSWCLSNPQKRKTRKGITRFVNSWLSREQDKGYRPPRTSEQTGTKSGYSQEMLDRLINERREDIV